MCAHVYFAQFVECILYAWQTLTRARAEHTDMHHVKEEQVEGEMLSVAVIPSHTPRYVWICVEAKEGRQSLPALSPTSLS